MLGLLSLNDRKDRVKARYNLIEANGAEIHQLVAQNAEYFKVIIIIILLGRFWHRK